MKDSRTSRVEQNLLTLKQVALALNGSRDLVERLIKRGELPAFDVSATRDRPRHRPMLRVQPKDLSDFLERRRVARLPTKSSAGRERRRGADDVLEFIK